MEKVEVLVDEACSCADAKCYEQKFEETFNMLYGKDAPRSEQWMSIATESRSIDVIAKWIKCDPKTRK